MLKASWRSTRTRLSPTPNSTPIPRCWPMSGPSMQDLIVGVSLQVSAPLGQYDDSKLLNLGNNRWSFRPELGISKAWGPWTFEVAPSVTFFSNNTDFVGGNTFAQAPIYAVQGHILYTFQSGVW